MNRFKNMMMVLSAALVLSVPALAGPIVYTQNFNSTTSSGALDVSPDASSTERANGAYFNILALPAGWSSTGGVYGWDSVGASDLAILLNENNRPTVLSGASLGLVSGRNYTLRFEHWGDNKSTSGDDADYGIQVRVNGTLLSSITRDGGAQNTGGFVTASINFTSNGADLITFTENSAGDISPVIDNVEIEDVTPTTTGGDVPEPSTVVLMSLGAIAVALRSKFRA